MRSQTFCYKHKVPLFSLEQTPGSGPLGYADPLLKVNYVWT